MCLTYLQKIRHVSLMSVTFMTHYLQIFINIRMKVGDFKGRCGDLDDFIRGVDGICDREVI